MRRFEVSGRRVVRAGSRGLVAMLALAISAVVTAVPVGAATAVTNVTFEVPTYPTGGNVPGTNAYANQQTDWYASFTANTLNPATVTVTFPTGFSITGAPTVALGGSFSGTCTGPTASATGTTVAVTIPGGCTLASGATGTVEFTAGVTNPPVTDASYAPGNFSLFTNLDTQAATPGSVPTLTASGSAVTGVTVNGATNVAHATESWTVNFSTSTAAVTTGPGPYGGALVAGDTMSVSFPTNFVIPATPTIGLTLADFGASCTATGVTTGQTVHVTLAGTCTLGNNSPASFTIGGVTNAPAGTYTNLFSVATSEDFTPVTGSATISPAGTAVTGVSFSATTYAGNAVATWSANFTPTSPAELTAGDSVSVTLPLSFSLTSPTLVTFAQGFIGGLSCAPENVIPSGGTLHVTIPSGCSLPGGVSARLSFALTNPPASTTYLASQFSILTSEDPAPTTPNSVSAITPSGSQVSSVTFSGLTNKAGVTETWTVGFKTSGAGALAAGDTVTATFPSTFTITSPTVTFVSGFSGSCAPVTGSVVGSTVTATLPSGCSLAVSTAAAISLSVTNPSAGSYSASSFSVNTSEDPTAVSPGSPVTILTSVTSVSAVTFTANSYVANSPSTWTAGFKTSSTGTVNAGGTITVDFPSGFVVSPTPTVSLASGFSGVGCAGYTVASATGTSVTLTLPASCSLPNSTSASVTINVTNPPVTDPAYAANNFSVATSSDVVAANPLSVPPLTASGSSVSSVAFNGLTNKGNATETWRVGFKTSNNGALVAGDTVTVVFPVSFRLSASPTIGLASGFTNCAATGTVVGSTLTVTLYNSGGTCSLPVSTSATLTITSVTNPPAGTYAPSGFSVATSEDQTPVSPLSSVVIIPSGIAVSAVRFTAISYAASTPTTWTVDFTPSVPGSLVAGDSVTATFPTTGGASDFAIGASPLVTFASTFNGGSSCSPTPGTFTNATGVLTVVLPSGCSLTGGYAASLTVAATNPATTTTYTASQFNVLTSEDPTPVSPSSVVAIGASGTAVTNVAFKVAQSPQPVIPSFASTNTAFGNQTSYWQASFTASSTGGLNPGDTVTFTLPAGFSLSSQNVTFGGALAGCGGGIAVANGDTLTVTVPGGCSMGAGLGGTVVFTATNPPATATFVASQFGVSTSEDPAFVSPLSGFFVNRITHSGLSPVAGAVTDTPSTGNVTAVLSDTFTTSSLVGTLAGVGPYGGALTPGDTVTVTVPAGFVITMPTTNVTLSGCSAVTSGSVSGSVGSGWSVTVTIPAGCSIANGTSATVTIDVTNPPAGAYTGFTIATSEDPTPATSASTVTLVATGSRVSGVTFGALRLAGNVATTWTVGFTPSLPGALAAGDKIIVVMPSAFFAASPTQKVTFASGFTGGAACVPVLPGYVSGGGSETVTITLPAGCSLAGGQHATITIALTNPPVTFLYATSQFSVETSADATGAVSPASVPAIVPSGSAVNTVTFVAAPTYGGNQASTWTVTFNTSTAGTPVGASGGALVAGDTIAVAFPAGFVIAGSPSATLSGCGALSSGTAVGSVASGWVVTLTLPSGCSVATGAAVTVTVAVTNPPVTDHYSAGQFIASTSEDPGAANPGSVSPIVASGTTTSNVTFSGATNKANVTETWTVGFKTSSNGALVAGDTLTADFPTSFGLVANPVIGLGGAFGGSCIGTGSVTGHTLVVTLSGTCSLGVSTSTSFTVASVMNPPAGTYPSGFSFATSEDPTLAFPPSVVITPTGGQVTGVTFSAGTYAGNTATTWTAGFTATTGGDLFPGDTVTITLPTSGGTSDFLITPTPTVNFTSGFVAGFLGCDPTVGTFTAATGTLVVTLPAKCTLAAGVSASISVAAVNPPVTTLYAPADFTIATNEDFTPASPATVHAIVPSGTVVSGVTFGATSYEGNQASTWTVKFKASSVGTPPPYGGALVAGDTISVAFPAGFVIAGSPAATLSGCGALSSGTAVGSVASGWVVTLTLPSGCSVATGAAVTVTVAVTNPPVTDHYSAGQFIASTSEDPGAANPGSVSPIVASGTTTSNVTFVAGTYRANQSTTWTATFSASALGGLVAGDTVTIGLPSTVTLVQPYVVTLGSFSGSCTITGSDVSANAGSVTVTVPVGCSLANGTIGATVAISAVNPPITVPAWTVNNFSVATSEDPSVVHPLSVLPLVQSGSQVSNVTVTATDYSGNRTVFWTTSFTTSNSSPVVGGLVAGDTVTVVYPTAFQIAAGSSVQLGGSFAGSCALSPAQVSITAATIVVTIPSGCTLANGATGSVLVSMINPPSTVRYLVGQFSVQTSEDPTVMNPIAVAPLVPSGPGVVPGSVTVTGYPNSTNTATLWSIGFTSSPTGKLTAGDTVMVVFPATVLIPTSTSVTLTGGFSGCTTVGASYNNHTLFFVLPIGCSLGASTSATFTVTSTSPIATGTYLPSAFAVSTSEDLVSGSPSTIVVGSPVSGSGTSTGGTSTSIPAPPPAGIAPSALGVPQSVIIGTTAVSIVLVSGSSIYEVTVPASSLPAGTTVSLYPVTTSSAASSLLASGSTYVTSVAVSWQTAGGSSPAAGSPLTMTVSDPSIVAGDVIYAVTPSGLQQVGVAGSNDMATVNFVNDPVFIVATASPQAQTTLSIKATSAVVGQAVTLTTSGGSGTGSVTFAITGGTATGCVLTGASLRASGPGTCVVVATKAGDATFAPTTAASTTITFRALVRPKPPVLRLSFTTLTSALTPAMRAAIAVLAHKLVRGASVIIQSFAFHNSVLARERALAIRSFLVGRTPVHVSLRLVTTSHASIVRVITTKQ